MGGIIGSIINAIGSMIAQHSANSANKDIMNMQMQFQEDMSNTAYQRAVKDMKAAGLNPALMFNSAAMASTPVGASTHVEPVMKGSEMSNILSSLLLRKQIESIDADINKTNAETENIEANTEQTKLVSEWYPSLSQAQLDNIVSGTGVNVSVEELNKAHKITAELENQWIPRLRSASALNLDSQTGLNQVNKFILDWDKTFRDTYGVRPGDSAVVDVTAFLCKMLGITASDAIEKVKAFLMKILGLGDKGGSIFDGLPAQGDGSIRDYVGKNFLKNLTRDEQQKIDRLMRGE